MIFFLCVCLFNKVIWFEPANIFSLYDICLIATPNHATIGGSGGMILYKEKYAQILVLG